MKKPLEQRFWEKVDIRGEDECWNWKAHKIPQGYGYISVGNVLSQKTMAKILNVSEATISHIRTGRNWSYIKSNKQALSL